MEFDGALFDQHFSAVLGLTDSLFSNRLEGRTHKGKPFLAFKELAKELEEIQATESVEADKNLNQSTKSFIAALDMLFLPEGQLDPNELTLLIMQMGTLAYRALAVAQLKVTKQFEVGLADLVLAGKLALIAAYFIETIKKKYPNVEENEEAVQKRLKKEGVTVSPKDTHTFVMASSRKVMRDIVETKFVKQTAENLLKRSTVQKAAADLQGTLSRRKLGSKSAISSPKIKVLDAHTTKVLGSILMIDSIFSNFSLGFFAGISTTDYESIDVPEHPGIWTQRLPTSAKRFKSALVHIDTFKFNIACVLDNEKVEVVDKTTYKSESAVTISHKETSRDMVSYQDLEGEYWVLLSNKHLVEYYNTYNGVKGVETLKHTSNVLCMAADCITSKLFTGCSNGDIKVWGMGMYDCYETVEHDSPVTALCVDENFGLKGALVPARVLVAGLNDGSLRCYSLLSIELVQTMKLPNAHPTRVHFVRSLDLEVYSADLDSLRVWDIGTKSRIKTFKNIHTKITGIAVNTEYLFTAGKEKMIKIWSLATWAMVKQVQTTASIKQIIVDANNSILTVEKNNILRWNIEGLLYKAVSVSTAIFGEKSDLDKSASGILMFSDLNFDEATPSTPSGDLDEVLSNPVYRRMFMVYTKSRHAEESLLFWIDVHRFEQVFGIASQRSTEREARRILDYYVREGSPYEVNIDSDQRKSLLGLKTFEKNSFADAKDEVYKLLDSNFFADFAKRFLKEEHV